MNTNADEIYKFESDQWWDEQGPFRTLHHINPARLQFVADEYDKFAAAARSEQAGSTMSPSPASILDIGCGGGIFTQALGAHYPSHKVTGIDLSQAAIRSAKNQALKTHSSVEYNCCDLQNLAQENVKFDLITCLEMLEHTANPQAIIQDIALLLKTGGMCVLSTISKNPIAFSTHILAAEYMLHLVPRGTHDYDRFLKPSTLALMCEHAGLKVGTIKGLTYNPITTKARITSRNLSGSYFLCAYNN